MPQPSESPAPGSGQNPAKPSLLARLFGQNRARPAMVRPLWHRLVAIAREKAWYAQLGLADSLPGRFDAVTLVLCAALLRMEGDETLTRPSVWLTEIFVTDMDGQLRESGVGDLVVGKHIGRLMSVLGGRLGAYRTALAASDDAELIAVITRNVTLTQAADPARIASAIRLLAAQLASLSAEQLLAGEIAR